jgi:hypothetical protein
MEWKELKEKVYYLDGSLRDIYIHNTTKEDWKIWADFVNEHYRISHHFFETDTDENKIRHLSNPNNYITYFTKLILYLNV